jgi:DNA-binding beta-propeller fold protein YncE
MRPSLAALSVALAAILSAGTSLSAADTPAAPLRLIHKIPLPSIDGDFDHFGVDVKGNRLFLAAEEHHSVELFALDSGKPLRSITGFDTPHSMVLLLDRNEIYVIDGGDGGAARVLNATTYKIEKSIPLTEDADAISYDESKHLLYVANGGKEAHNDYSAITVLDTDKGERARDFRVSSANLEAIALQKDGPLLYVNARDKNEIAIVDRATGTVKAMWPLQSVKHNTPLFLDETHHRLLVAGRKPGRFGVLDSDSGKEILALAAGDDVDDMAFDPATRRIYLACGEGFIDVFHQSDADHYEEVGRVKTTPGAKTGVLVPQLHRYYAVSARKGSVPAMLFVFEVPL